MVPERAVHRVQPHSATRDALRLELFVVTTSQAAQSQRRPDTMVPSEVDGLAELIIAKQRNGPTGTVKTAFIAGQTKFMPLAT